MNVLRSFKCFGGTVENCKHDSRVTGTPMNFAVFRPEGKIRGALIWLSGLECNDQNFITKAGAQKSLSQAGIMVVCPDTSPRGLNLPHEHESYDFGAGAGFYVDATTPGYRDHYRMYTYVGDELYTLINQEYGVENRVAISGHSMGGHGALVLGLREPDRFRSVSAFAPIAHPIKAPWGQKAFRGYLGEDQQNWYKYDATELLRGGAHHAQEILVDQGTADKFLVEQLCTEDFVKAAAKAGQKVRVNYRDGYDHSYYFISTFIDEHVRFHADFF